MGQDMNYSSLPNHTTPPDIIPNKPTSYIMHYPITTSPEPITSKAPEKLPDICAQLNILGTNLENIDYLVKRLVEKLTPILRQSPQKDASSTQGAQVSEKSPMGQCLRERNVHLACIKDILEMLLKDIDI